MSAVSAENTRHRDPVPTWSGEASSFQEFAEAAELFVEMTPYHKRSICAPRIIGALTGAARRMVSAKPANWVSHPQGVRDLLDFLRSCLGRPQITDFTDFMSKYFRGTKRQLQESMNSYITRKMDTYLRAKRGLSRVTPSAAPYWKGSSGQWGQSWSHSGSWPRNWGAPGPDRPDPQTSPEERNETFGTSYYGTWPRPGGPGENRLETEADRGPRDTTEGDAWSNWQGSDAGDSRAWSWRWSEGSQWTWEDTWSGSSWCTDRASDAELLPEFVQGWYLLYDANLETKERNMIQTALRGDLSVAKVSQELRNQWTEAELKKYDQGRRQQGFLGDHMEDEEQLQDGDIYALDEEMDPQEQILWSDLEQQAQTALAALHQNRQTLREARTKQYQLKMSRKFYPPSSRQAPKSLGGPRPLRDDSGMTCLKCGKVGHRAAHCPTQETASHVGATGEPKESAPFICYAEETPEAEDTALVAQSGALSTQEAVQRGMGILDGGATRSLASVKALEAIQEINRRKHGTDKIVHVNLQERPEFGFGNSSTDRCCSTVDLEVSAAGSPGMLRIHALNKGQGPVLLSVDCLRRLGAVLDFEKDLVCFRKLSSNKVVRLERSQTGHQLLPLTEDLLEHAQETSQEVPSLEAFI